MKLPLRRYGGVGGVLLLKRLGQRPLIKSVLALFSSALFGRVMGTAYRVALVRVAGQDAVGLVQLALPVYRIARSLATLGLPVAIAKLTAERTEVQGRPDLSAFRMGLQLTLWAGLLAFLVQALFSRFWSVGVLSDGRTEIAVLVLAALLPLIAVTQALRGAVQGLQRQDFLAGSDAAEVAIRIPVTLFLVALAVPSGPCWIAAAVAAGFIAGELGSLVILWLGLRKAVVSPQYASGRRVLARSGVQPLRLRDLVGLGLPLMVTGFLNNVMSVVTVALIPRLLQEAGMALTDATRAYGRLSGMALPTLYMPMVAIYPVAQVALPEITRLASHKDSAALIRLRHLVRKVYWGTSAVVLCVVPFLWFQADWLGAMLYGDATVGELIRPLAVAVPFAYLGTVSMGTLHGLGCTAWTMVSSMTGNALRVVLVYFLAGQPGWGIIGVLWAFIVDSAVTGALDILGVVWVMRKNRRPR